MMKKCQVCNEFKEHSSFNKDRTNPDGLNYRCSDCNNKRLKQYREKIKESNKKGKGNKIKSKHCNSCNQIKSIKNFSKDITKLGGFSNYCRGCNKIQVDNRVSKNPELYKKKQGDNYKRWKKKNYKKVLESKRNYRLKNKAKINKYTKNRYASERELLSDWYVKALIVNGTILKFEDIPQEMVEAKREHLKLYRIIREEK